MAMASTEAVAHAFAGERAVAALEALVDERGLFLESVPGGVLVVDRRREVAGQRVAEEIARAGLVVGDEHLLTADHFERARILAGARRAGGEVLLGRRHGGRGRRLMATPSPTSPASSIIAGRSAPT
jgi:hypothetical protein